MAGPVIPFDYYERQRRQTRASDPVADTLANMRAKDARQTILESGNPDDVARTTRIARDAGENPSDVEGNADAYEKALTAKRFADVAQANHATGRWAIANPRGAAAAADDTQNLSLLGQAWDGLKSFVTGIPGALNAGLQDGARGINDLSRSIDQVLLPIANPNGARALLDQEASYSKDYTARGDAAFPKGRGKTSTSILQGVRSIPSSLTAAALTALTRSPAIGTGFIGATTGATSYQEGLGKGLSGPEALRYGLAQGGTEALTEYMPAGTLADLITRRTPFGKTVLRELSQELVGENTATVVQDLADWAYLPENRNKTFADYLKARPQAALDTTLATIGGVGGTTALVGAVHRATDATASVAGRVQDARQAQAERTFLDQAATAATSSKLKQRDPEAFRDLIREHAQDANAQSVFIPGDAIRTLMQQSDDLGADPGLWRGWQEAAQSGGDVVMPIEDFLTDVVGTPAWDAIKDDVRLTQGGISPREAQAFDDAMSDVIGRAADEMRVRDQADQASKSVRDKLVDQVATMFGGSFTSPVARQYAEIAVQRAQARAARLGMDLKGDEFNNLDVRQVLPESVAQARQADRLDLVINAMRKRADANYGVGPSLLDFIKKRGGVNDVGGDLASMGVPSKYLTGFDPRQTEMMGGLSGIGDYGLDNTLQAAITAGYFPDLANVENEAGPSTLDTQTLLDAIAEEIAGRPRYADNRTDDVRASAEDLRQMLDEAGHSPSEMSDAEIRSVIDDMAKPPASGRAYQQDARGQIVFDQGRQTIELFQSRNLSTPIHELGHMWLEELRFDASLPEAPEQVKADWAAVQRWFAANGHPIGGPKGVALLHGSPNANLTLNDVQILRDPALQKQGKKGRQYGGFYAAAEDRISDAEGYAGANGSVYEVRLSPDAVIEEKQGDITRLTAAQIAEYRARGVDAVYGKDPRGRVEYAVLNKDAIASFGRRGEAEAESFSGAIPTDAHELFARGIEAYFMEGKAPTPALTRIFENVRQWMVSIYKTVANLRAPISSEIREVFDRMLATDEEIAAAQERQGIAALFKDAASVGMSDAEFQAYQAQAGAARAASHASLLDKTMKAIRRRETERYREARKGVREEQVQRIDASPVYRALANIKADRISKEWIVDRMALDALELLPKRVPPLYRDGGVNPETIAEMSGYRSATEMLESLIGAEQAHRQAKEGGDPRSMRERAIETATDEEMNRRYGDPLNDGSIEREALAAVENEQQGEVIAAEIRVLGRTTGGRPTPYRAARDWARSKVRSGRWVDEVSPGAIQRHARNAAKAGRLAEEALAKGDREEAYRQKQFQMLNSALITEAKAAADEVESAVKRMDAIARATTRKSVDQEYLEQAQTLLEAVDLRRRSQIYEKRKGRFAAWAQARETEGYDVIVPDTFEVTLGQTNWSQLPADAILTLDETVKQIMHLGRLKQTLLDNQEEREWEAVINEAVDAAGNLRGKPPADLAERGWWDGLKSRVFSIDASLLKMETVFDWLDGGDPNGIFNRVAFRPVAEAQAQEQDMLKDYYGRIKALFEAVPASTVERWNDVETPPFIDPHTERPMRVNRKQLVAMALNVGNEGNLQRLADGYRVNPEAIISHLDQTLTADEWTFVQGVWNTIDTLWPQIEALERRVNGVAPEKIAPREFTLGNGTKMKGGYYPAIYDSSRDYRAEQHSGRESDVFESRYTRATTRASSTKERSEQVKRPILLDLGVINRHLGEVIHDVTHREAVIKANRFLSSEQVRRAVEGALGQEIGQQFRPWVKHVANAWAMERAGNEGFGHFLGKLRANVTAVGMGLRATTMVTQIAGYSNSAEVVGEAAIAKAVASFSAHPIETTRFVMERSDEVRHRMDTLDRDVSAEINRLAATNPVGRAARTVVDGRRFFYHGIGYIDRVVSVPTWMAGYNNALAAGMSERDAAYAGDKAVRQSQGSGAPKDLAAIQRGTGKWGEALKLMTMFYSYFSAQYQRERTLGRDIGGQDERRPRNVPRLAARAFFLLILPTIATELLRASVGASAGPDDDEWWAQWFSRKVLANAIGPIPVARDVFEPSWNAVVGNQVFAPTISPVARALESFVKGAGSAAKVAKGEKTKHATKDVLEAVGYSTGLVPGQIASATQFLVDVGQGDADPETFGDWLQGLSTGKIKDD